MIPSDFHELARQQLCRDRAATTRFGDLFAHKISRISPSPFAYLRGTAPLFYQILEEHSELTKGPPGRGWLVGDAHLENFGAYRTEKPAGERSQDARKGGKRVKRAREDAPVVFDINDFDEAFEGPWRLDVLRLVTSLMLAGRSLGVDGPTTLQLARGLLDGYVASCFGFGHPTDPPPAVAQLVSGTEKRTHRDLLESRTHLEQGERRFILGARYIATPPGVREPAIAAFQRYAARCASRDQVGIGHFEVLDVAFRIAGTGSVGGLRIAILTRGKGGGTTNTDDAWIFDMKEEGAPSGIHFANASDLKPAKRVVTGLDASLDHRPRMLGTAKLELDGRGERAGTFSMLVRRLAPQEDKLVLSCQRSDQLPELASYLGALLGRAHRRGMTRTPAKPPATWGPAHLARLLENAITLAAIHEGAYLAMCQQTRGQSP